MTLNRHTACPEFARQFALLAIDEARGATRAWKERCIAAGTQYKEQVSLTETFRRLAYRQGNRHTQTYGYHLAKLRWYCEIARVTPSRWSMQDVEDFYTFLEDLPDDAFCAMEDGRYALLGEGHSPFRKRPAKSSQSDIHRFVHALLKTWHSMGYIRMALTGTMSGRKIKVERSISESRRVLPTVRSADKESILDFFGDRGNRKGAKERRVPVTRALLASLMVYRQAFGLPALPSHGDDSALLLSSRTKPVQIGDKEIRLVNDRRFFGAWRTISTRQGLYKIVQERRPHKSVKKVGGRFPA